MQRQDWLFTIQLRLRSLLCGAQAGQELDELRDHLARKSPTEPSLVGSNPTRASIRVATT